MRKIILLKDEGIKRKKVQIFIFSYLLKSSYGLFDELYNKAKQNGWGVSCAFAEASFFMGTLLTITGILCLKKTRDKSLKWIALIPLLFGIQQLFEGIVWLHMTGQMTNDSLARIAQMAFVSFAWLLWPIYSPFAFFQAAKSPGRKLLCALCFLTGLAIVYVDLRFLFSSSFKPIVMGNSIYYPASPMYGNFIYGTVTLLPIFFSEIKKMWIFGACLLASFIMTEIIWAYTFTSVWCFFVATTSFILFFILKKSNEKERFRF